MNDIQQALIVLENDRLKLENLMLSAGVKPRELKTPDMVFSSAESYSEASKKALIEFLKSRKEMLMAMDDFSNTIKALIGE